MGATPRGISRAAFHSQHRDQQQSRGSLILRIGRSGSPRAEKLPSLTTPFSGPSGPSNGRTAELLKSMVNDNYSFYAHLAIKGIRAS